MAVVTIKHRFNRQGLAKLNLKKALNAKTLTAMGNTALHLMNPYIPYRGGTLRQSGKVIATTKLIPTFTLRWNPFIGSRESEFKKTPIKSYGRYIYEGKVMGPNKQKAKTGEWYSAADTKELTGKDMVYHTPGTRSHWGDVIARNGVKYNDFRTACKQILKKELNNG